MHTYKAHTCDKINCPLSNNIRYQKLERPLDNAIEIQSTPTPKRSWRRKFSHAHKILAGLLFMATLTVSVQNASALDPGNISVTTPTGTSQIKVPVYDGTQKTYYVYIKIQNTSATEDITALRVTLDATVANISAMSLGNGQPYEPRTLREGMPGPTNVSSSQSTDSNSRTFTWNLHNSTSPVATNRIIPHGTSDWWRFAVVVRAAQTMVQTLTINAGTTTSANIPAAYSLQITQDSSQTSAPACPAYFAGIPTAGNSNCTPYSVCPTGYTGTAPFCTPPVQTDPEPPTGGSGATPTEPDNISPRDVQLISLALATFTAYILIKQFRWRSHD